MSHRHVSKRSQVQNGWTGATVIAQAGFGPGGIPTSGQRILFRRVGNDLEGWRSIDGGATWTREITATDSTYTTNLRIAAGFSIAVASRPSWDDFGGGAIDEPPPPGGGSPPGRLNGITGCGRGSIALTASCTFADPVNSRTGADADAWEGIRRHGLLSTSALLDLFEVDGDLRPRLEAQRRPASVTVRHDTYGSAVMAARSSATRSLSASGRSSGA